MHQLVGIRRFSSPAAPNTGGSPSASLPDRRVVVFQSFAHADDVVGPVTDGAIELDYLRVGGSDLKVDLRTPNLREQALGLRHHRTTQAAAALIRIDGEIIDPPAMALVTRHHRRENLVIDDSDEKQLRVDLHLSCDVVVRIVPRSQQIAAPPEVNHVRFVGDLERADVHEDSRADARPPYPGEKVRMRGRSWRDTGLLRSPPLT